MGYYGFVQKVDKGYKLTIEHGMISNSPYDYTQVIDVKENLSKDEVNKFIKSDCLGTTYFYNGCEIGILW